MIRVWETNNHDHNTTGSIATPTWTSCPNCNDIDYTTSAVNSKRFVVIGCCELQYTCYNCGMYANEQNDAGRGTYTGSLSIRSKSTYKAKHQNNSFAFFSSSVSASVITKTKFKASQTKLSLSVRNSSFYRTPQDVSSSDIVWVPMINPKSEHGGQAIYPEQFSGTWVWRISGSAQTMHRKNYWGALEWMESRNMYLYTEVSGAGAHNPTTIMTQHHVTNDALFKSASNI